MNLRFYWHELYPLRKFTFEERSARSRCRLTLFLSVSLTTTFTRYGRPHPRVLQIWNVSLPTSCCYGPLWKTWMVHAERATCESFAWSQWTWLTFVWWKYKDRIFPPLEKTVRVSSACRYFLHSYVLTIWQELPADQSKLKEELERIMADKRARRLQREQEKDQDRN